MTTRDATAQDQENGLDERPVKKPRLASPTAEHQVKEILIDLHTPLSETNVRNTKMEAITLRSEADKEAAVGITAYVKPRGPRFSGILKKRYTDFLVNEILPSGRVLHLQDLKVSRAARGQKPGQQVPEDEDAAGKEQAPIETRQGAENLNSATETNGTEKVVNEGGVAFLGSGDLLGTQVGYEDRLLLISYFNETAVQELIELHEKILSSQDANPESFGIVKTEFTSDRTVRGKIHQDIRRIFDSKIDSSTDKDGMLTLFPAARARAPRKQGGRGKEGGSWGRGKGKPTWADRGGDYVHFTLYKENKDTMEVMSFLTRQLNTKPKVMQFAGTKDRRGVTVQRVSGYRIEAERLAGMNKTLRSAAIGDYEYHKHGLELGDLEGNEFVITLRDCQFEELGELPMREKIELARTQVGTAIDDLRERGFFNYYGLQRFGTFSTRTDTIGIKLLQGDFKGACDGILEFSEETLTASSTEKISSDDRLRAEALNLFKTTGSTHEALEKLPRKFSAESNIMRHLGKNSNDYVGALMMVQRNMRLMYVHAYQSLVWNFAVGERWKLYGDKVVKGDLVMIDENKEKIGSGESRTISDDIAKPDQDEQFAPDDDIYDRARSLTAEEAGSGAYTIFDVVLPLPGYDVVYPQNEMEKWYKSFMAQGGLDPHDMRRKQKDFSLSGSYRKVLARIGADHSVEVKTYSEDDEQFVTTDLAKLRANGEAQATEERSTDGEGDKIAIILKFQLGSSQYATMALRELSRGGVSAHKPDFSGGR